MPPSMLTPVSLRSRIGSRRLSASRSALAIWHKSKWLLTIKHLSEGECGLPRDSSYRISFHELYQCHATVYLCLYGSPPPPASLCTSS
jgi:hypothetical protein